MDPAIRQAVTWIILCLSVVMTLFTWVDISGGDSGTAVWLSAVAWPLVAGLSAWVLAKNPYQSPDRED